jgi:rhamnose transport system permease protein
MADKKLNVFYRILLEYRELVLFGVLVAMFIGFSVTVEGFLDWYNILDRTRYWVVPGMIAVPMTFVIATSGIDLSVASILALSGIVMGVVHTDLGMPIAVGAFAAVLTGLLAGGFNGAVSSYLAIPPLVVTLATMTLYRGVAMGLSEARAFSVPPGFLQLSQGDAFWISTGGGDAAPVPWSLLILFGVVAIGVIFMRKSWVGRFTLCIGENETAARFAAIPVRHLKALLFAATGLVAGAAALFHTALYSTAKADTAMGMELEAIACVVVGGTRISGGQASVVGTLLGLCIIGILRYGLLMADVSTQHIEIVIGALLIVTVVLNEWIARRRALG